MSSYRDDREALRARSNALEKDVEAKQKEIDELRAAGPPQEQLDKLAKDLSDAQREVARLRAQYQKKPPSNAPRVALLGLVLAGVGAGAYFATRSSKTEAVATPKAPGDPLGTAARPAPLAPREDPSVDAPKPAPPPKPPPRQLAATWSAKVKRAKGSDVKVGAACKISAALVEDERRLYATGVSVKCGETSLYTDRDKFNGMSNMTSTVYEEPSAAGFVRALVYGDKGARTGKKLFVLDTRARTARLWDEEAAPTEIELDVEMFDAPSEVAIDSRSPRRCTRTDGRGRVKSAEGRKDVPVGAACVVRTTPEDLECKVTVKCGAVALYDGGYAQVRDGVVVDDQPTPDGGDPKVRIDGLHVSLSDEGPDWKVEIERDR